MAVNYLRGVAICTYNRGNKIGELIESVKDTVPSDTRVVVCDDGSIDMTSEQVMSRRDIIYVRGPNLGVAANKNRALWTLQDCAYICILEDDLFPTQPGWFEVYQGMIDNTGIHHFCRVQDKLVDETVPEFTEYLDEFGYTPIYGPSPRGDFTFISNEVIRKVGGFHPDFIGAGYAHGEWSGRVAKAGLIPHPLKWIDIKEVSESFVQKGDTEGGRWLEPKQKIKDQLKANHALAKKLRRAGLTYTPLTFS